MIRYVCHYGRAGTTSRQSGTCPNDASSPSARIPALDCSQFGIPGLYDPSMSLRRSFPIVSQSEFGYGEGKESNKLVLCDSKSSVFDHGREERGVPKIFVCGR